MNGVTTVATDAEIVGSEISEGSVDSSRKVKLASNENSEMGQQEGVEGSMRLFVGGVTLSRVVPDATFQQIGCEKRRDDEGSVGEAWKSGLKVSFHRDCGSVWPCSLHYAPTFIMPDFILIFNRFCAFIVLDCLFPYLAARRVLLAALLLSRWSVR